jgi:hypothetical protein
MKSKILTETMGVMTKNKTYNCLKKESNLIIFLSLAVRQQQQSSVSELEF